MIKEINEPENLNIDKGNFLVMVSTPSCGPCKNMKNNVLPELEGTDIIIIDATKNMNALNVIQNLSGPIRSVPVFVLFKDGEVVKRKDGAMNLEETQEFIESD